MTNPLDTLDWLLKKTRSFGADAADAVMFDNLSISTTQRMGKPEGIERSESTAIGLRCLVGKKQAIASTTDTSPEALAELAERASSMAKAAAQDPFCALAPAELYARELPALDLCDAIEPEADWLYAQCKEAEEAAMAVAGITNSEGADASYSRSNITLAIDNGGSLFAQTYASSHFSVSVSVLAGEGTNMERDYDYASVRHRTDLPSSASIGREASRLALARLNPRKPATAQMPVLFDPRVSKSLVGVLAASISGSAIARGASFLKNDMGKALFAPNVQIIDDPHIVRGQGSRPFDGEGVKNGKRTLIENGVLTGWLLDMRSATKLGLPPTGNAARGLSSPPSPSSSNLYMAAGTVSPAELMADIKSGLLVTETFGMGINTITGDYSQGASGFWIESGKIAYPVSELTIAGNLRDMFASLTPANDLSMRYATNAPTVRIASMTVAGA